MRVPDRRPIIVPYKVRPPGIIRPYRLAFRGLGALGDDTPATIAQIEASGYDPNDANYTYTIDSTGNVQANPTTPVVVSASVTASGAAQQTPISPLLLVLAMVFGVTYYAGSQHGK